MMRRSALREHQNENRGQGQGWGTVVCASAAVARGAALDSHLTPSTKSVRDVITDTAHTRNRKPDTERHVTTNNFNYNYLVSS